MERLGIEEVIHACGATPFNCSKIAHITGIATDSRKLKKGDMFVAIKGERFNGHEFVEDALKDGAAIILSQEKLKIDIPYILVEDTIKALHRLAKYYKNKFTIPFIAITGSSGKTTTKDMVASVLSEKYKVLKTEGNFNNAIGLPLTLFGLEHNHELCVLEMGMNSLGEIELLAEIARPETGIITNVGTAHIEKLKSRENILKAKMEMFTYFNETNTAVINGDNDMLKQIGNKPYKVLKYGLNDNNDCKAFNIVEKGEEGIDFEILYQNRKEKYHVPIPGIHNIYNALSAICIGKMYDLSSSQIYDGLVNFKPSKMRMEIFMGKQNIKVINDVYNANPDSVMAAISALTSMEVPGRKVCILGDMFELGDYSKEGHEKVGIFAAESKMDLVIAVGQMSFAIINGASKLKGGSIELHSFSTNQEVIDNLKNILKSSDTILIKGSRGMHMESIVESLREGR
ncbi:MAG: UDP-N-acetylmuramoyl-tripeptide--D-alanyl-D-alanine ligase [Lutisporaceae bacterium]